MVVGVKGLSREVVEGLEKLVEEEVVEVCKKAEQVLLHGVDNNLEVDAGVKHVVFALITLVSSNSQIRRLRDNNDDRDGPGVDNRVVNAVV